MTPFCAPWLKKKKTHKQKLSSNPCGYMFEPEPSTCLGYEGDTKQRYTPGSAEGFLRLPLDGNICPSRDREVCYCANVCLSSCSPFKPISNGTEFHRGQAVPRHSHLVRVVLLPSPLSRQSLTNKKMEPWNTAGYWKQHRCFRILYTLFMT